MSNLNSACEPEYDFVAGNKPQPFLARGWMPVGTVAMPQMAGANRHRLPGKGRGWETSLTQNRIASRHTCRSALLCYLHVASIHCRVVSWRGHLLSSIALAADGGQCGTWPTTCDAVNVGAVRRPAANEVWEVQHQLELVSRRLCCSSRIYSSHLRRVRSHHTNLQLLAGKLTGHPNNAGILANQPAPVNHEHPGAMMENAATEAGFV